jgi:hypothetical protein
MNITIEIGDFDTSKDFITHLKVIISKLKSEQKRLNTTDILPEMNLSDSNCYGWHIVEINSAE